MSNAEWTAKEVAQELLDLFELDSGRSDEGWGTVTRSYEGNQFALLLGKQTFIVTVEKVRG